MPQWLGSNGTVCKSCNSSNDDRSIWGIYTVAVFSIIDIKAVAVFTDSAIMAVYTT